MNEHIAALAALAALSTSKCKFERTPIVTDYLTIGRNQDCPCGSREKFKRCCGKRKVYR